MLFVSGVIKKYPQNPLYRFVGIIADYENKNYDKVIADARAFLAKIGKDKFYNDIYIARSYTAIGSAQMAQGDWAAAKATFEQSIKATKKQEMSRWQLWNNLRLAQVLDVLCERERALKIYKEIIARKQNWGIDDVAKQYLKKPYAEGTPLGRMSPP